MMPLISIIIPVYNTEKYIRRCIDSVIAQSYSDWELILVDDGSTDGSGKICDEYAESDERIRVYHKTNGGVSSARNVGLDNATGEWVTFVDSDDWVEATYLQEIYNNCCDTDVLFFSAVWNYLDGCKVTYSAGDRFAYGKDAVEREIFMLLYNKSEYPFLGYTWNKAFKKSIINNNNVRFREDLSVREDEIFTHDYLRFVEGLKYMSKPLYQYRVLQSGLTHRVKKVNEILALSDCYVKVSEYYANKELHDYLINAAIKRKWDAFWIEKDYMKLIEIIRDIDIISRSLGSSFSKLHFIHVLLLRLIHR